MVNFKLVYGLAFHEVSIPQVDRVPISCLGGHTLQYVTINNESRGILSIGQGCFLVKTDIESAFQIIPLKPDDYELCGTCWEGKYYNEKCLPFGLRSAPYIFNLLSDAVERILSNKCSISSVSYPRRFSHYRAPFPFPSSQSNLSATYIQYVTVL